MGRKLCLKRIENITKRQVTYSKRRSGIMKKCREISVCCDADVAFVAFSPSGRITKFSFSRRIEDVIERYANLPANMRYNDTKNVQDKIEKLRYLHHVEVDNSKLPYLDQRIENLELQITKKTVELQIMDADISAYEPPQDKDLTLNQLVWNEKNVKHSLQKVIERKNTICESFSLPQGSNNLQVQMPCEGVSPFFDNFSGSGPNAHGANPSLGKLPMKLDPWIVPHSAEVREGFLPNVTDEEKGRSMLTQAIASPNNYCIRGIPEKIQPQHPLTVQEPQFVPPAKNAAKSISQCDSEIPSWNVINNALTHNLFGIQPPDHERSILPPLDENNSTTFAFNNGQIAIERIQAPNDQILPAANQQTFGINELNGNNINNPANFVNMNNNNGDNGGSDCLTEVYIPIAEEINSPLALFSDTFSFEKLFGDDTPWPSLSQAEEGDLLNRNWDGLVLDNIKHLLD